LLEDGRWHPSLAQGGVGDALAFGVGLDRCHEVLLERIEIDRLVLGREPLLDVEPLLDQVEPLGRVGFDVNLGLDSGGILGRLAPARLVGLSLKSGEIIPDGLSLAATFGQCLLVLVAHAPCGLLGRSLREHRRSHGRRRRYCR
jgi:hypothetical protein